MIGLAADHVLLSEIPFKKLPHKFIFMGTAEDSIYKDRAELVRAGEQLPDIVDDLDWDVDYFTAAEQAPSRSGAVGLKNEREAANEARKQVCIIRIPIVCLLSSVLLLFSETSVNWRGASPQFRYPLFMLRARGRNC